MKKIYLLTLLTMTGLTALTSCSNDELDPLEGIYQAPTLSSVNNVTSVDKTSDEAGLRHFTIRLTGGSDDITFEMIGSEYYLQSATFAPNVNSTATVNTYISERSTVNGNKIVRGNVLVFSEDNLNYEVSGTVWTADGNIVKFDAEGVLEYEPDAIVVDPIYGTAVIETSPLYGADANGNWGPIEGCFEHLLSVMDGDAKIAQFDIYSDNEFNLSGTYTVAENRAEAGVMNNGWVWGESSGGTVLYTNGNTYMVKSGEMTVEDTDTQIVLTCYGAGTQDAEGNAGPVNFIYIIQK